MQTITPFLWFDHHAEEAIQFYLSIFKDGKLLRLSRFGPDNRFTSAEFELNGQRLMALDAGPQFKFTEAVSLFIYCDTQEEVDDLWEKLSEGGSKGRCGWLKDKYGLSWQVVPKALGRLMGDQDREKAGRVVNAMMQMTKIDTAVLEKAYAGK